METIPREKPLIFSLFMDLIYGLENFLQVADWSGGKGARKTGEELCCSHITASTPSHQNSTWIFLSPFIASCLRRTVPPPIWKLTSSSPISSRTYPANYHPESLIFPSPLAASYKPANMSRMMIWVLTMCQMHSDLYLPSLD